MSLETTTADEFGRGNVLSAGILPGATFHDFGMDVLNWTGT